MGIMNKKKEQLLKMLRFAVFYQVELWDTVLTISELLGNCLEGELDPIARLGQVREVFGEKILADSDLEVFLTGTDHVLPDGTPFLVAVGGETRIALRQNLQKALWIQNELWSTCGLIGEILDEITVDVIRKVAKASITAESGCELGESDLDDFLGDTPEGTVRHGGPRYL
jgi:hypothetical protein